MRSLCLWAFGLVAVLCVTSSADTLVSLVPITSPSYTIDGAIFEYYSIRSSGSGVLDPFVRIQKTNAEEGYNTDFRPTQFDEKTNATFTHSVLLSAIPTITRNGIGYYELLFDANENQDQPDNLLVMTDFEVYVFTTAMKSGYPTGWGAPVYDIDGGMTKYDLQIDSQFSNGSGSSDVRALLPTSLLKDYDANTSYFYLYTRYTDTEATFEEWGHASTTYSPPAAPLPAAAWMGLAGLVGVVATKIRRK